MKEEPSDLESEAGDVKREAGAVNGLGGGSGLSVLIARQHKFLDSVREVSKLMSCLADVKEIFGNYLADV